MENITEQLEILRKMEDKSFIKTLKDTISWIRVGRDAFKDICIKDFNRLKDDTVEFEIRHPAVDISMSDNIDLESICNQLSLIIESLSDFQKKLEVNNGI